MKEGMQPDYKKTLKQIDKILSKFYNDKKKSFVPGKTTISLISPSYGKEEVLESIESLMSTWVTMGKKVSLFEKKFAKYIGVKYALMVNSGSSANLMALSILSNPEVRIIEKNSEIITPAVTWATTVYPMINIGAKPVFVDVDPERYTVDTNLMKEAVSRKTSALMPVHLVGNSCNMDSIVKISKKNNIALIEDACEAHGAEFKGKKVGSFGDISTFSFFMSHHITTIEGGMVLTNNKKYHEIGKALRAFGWTRDLTNKNKISKKFNWIDNRFLFINLGFNLRPTEIQGAFGIHQMKKLKSFIKIRRENARYWNKKFNSIKDLFILPKETPLGKHSYFCYPLTIKENTSFTRKEITKFLNNKKIETRPIMTGNIVEQPASKLFDYRIYGKLDNSELIMRNGFFFANHQDIGSSEREYTADSILEFINKKVKK